MTGPLHKPVVLCILDGWGHRTSEEDNAIAQALTPNYDHYLSTCPSSLLRTSGTDVGLPHGQMGNSEVGHMNIGAGRIISQDLPRLDAALADTSLFKSKGFTDLISKLQKSQGTCHLMGLLSPGGVHSHQRHISILGKELRAFGIPVAVHVFLDGRDTPPISAADYMGEYLNENIETDDFKIATVSGRYYAMDRDNRWDRTKQAYTSLVNAQGEHAENPISAIIEAYDDGHTDEFIPPTIVGDYTGIRDGDGLLMANFRADRVRQILTALIDPAFDAFKISRTISFAAMAGAVHYSTALSDRMETLLPQENVSNTLGEVIAESGCNQLRIAETEKYAHVTFFFNGGREQAFAGEHRILIPSPKIATYDEKPEMSAAEVTDELIKAVASKHFDFILVNYANPDMVGHTGELNAAIRAVEFVDNCLGQIHKAVSQNNGSLVITADHGNVECMRDPDANQPHTYHTTELVPFLITQPSNEAWVLENGCLADVAPTVLELLRLPKPPQMTGTTLLKSPN